MSVDAGTIYSEVRIALDKLTGDIQGVQKQFDQLGQKLGQQSQQQAGQVEKSWSDGFLKLKVAGVAAFAAVSLFVKNSVQEYLKAEESSTKLGSALKSTGDSSNYTRARMESYATALQGVTKFEDEATQNAMSLMMTLGGMTSSMAERAIPAVQDLASAMGMDLEQAAMLVSKAVEGNVGALGRYGIKIDASGTSAERLAAVVKGLEDRFGGLSRAVGDTAGGKLVQLKNAFSNVQEEVGRTTINAVQPFVTWLGEVVKGLADFMKKANDLHDALLNQSKGIADINDKLIIARARYSEVNTTLHNLSGMSEAYLKHIMAMDPAVKDTSMTTQAYVQVLMDEQATLRGTIQGLETQASREKALAEAKAKAAKDAAARLAALPAEEAARRKAIADSIDAEDERVKRFADGLRKEAAARQANADSAAKLHAEAKEEDAKFSFEAIEAEVKANNEAADEEEKALERRQKAWQNFAKSIPDYFQDMLSAITDLSRAQADAQIEEIDRTLKAQEAAIDAQLQAALEAAGVAEETESQRLQRQLNEAVATGDAINIKKAQDELTRFNIEDTYEKKRTEAQKKAEKEKAQIQYQADHAAWQAKIAGALADAAKSIINIWSAWAWNPFAAVAMTIATAVVTGIQLEAIRTAEPKPPAFQTGGIVLPSSGNGRLVRVAENGAPELLLNAGTEGEAFVNRIADKIAQRMNAGGTVTSILNVDGKKMAEVTARYFNKGITRLDR